MKTLRTKSIHREHNLNHLAIDQSKRLNSTESHPSQDQQMAQSHSQNHSYFQYKHPFLSEPYHQSNNSQNLQLTHGCHHAEPAAIHSPKHDTPESLHYKAPEPGLS